MQRVLLVLSAVGLVTVLTSSNVSAQRWLSTGGCDVPAYRRQVVQRSSFYPSTSFYSSRSNYPSGYYARDYQARHRHARHHARHHNARHHGRHHGRHHRSSLYRSNPRYLYGNSHGQRGRGRGISVQGRRFGVSLRF